jgi:WD40 repeat protein
VESFRILDYEQMTVTTVRQPGPITALALSRDGQDLYALNADQSAITSVDVESQKVTHVKLGGVDINSLAIHPGGKIVWASQYSFGLGGETIFLDPANWQTKYVVNISGAIAFSPDGKVVYFYHPGGVTAYDVASLTPIGSAYVGQLTNLGQARWLCRANPPPSCSRCEPLSQIVPGRGNRSALLRSQAGTNSTGRTG